MSKFCDTCGRGAQNAHKISHSNIKTKTLQHVNLQVRRMGGSVYRLCTRCLRTMNKNASLLEKAGTVPRRLITRDKRQATKVKASQTKRKTHPTK